MVKAVIDVGSNSVLLLVEQFHEGSWKLLTEKTFVTSLGENTKSSGILKEDRIVDTLKALDQCFQIAKQFGAETTVAGATMAARIASNSSDFLARAEQQGTPVFVVSGEQEAEMGFWAVANDPAFVNHDRISIIDIGGQSTELVTAERTSYGWDVGYRNSFAIGTLALLADLLKEEIPGPMEKMKALAWIDDSIGLAYRPNQAGGAIVLGATGTNLVSIRDRMTSWDPDKVHGAVLDYEEVSKAWAWLSSISVSERAAIVGIEPGREKTLPINSLILERFLFALRCYQCQVSVRGWRHALLEREGAWT